MKPNFSVSSRERTPIKKAKSTVLLTPAIGAGTVGARSSKDVVAISDSPVKHKGDLEWLDRATMEMKGRSRVIVASMEEGPDGFLLYRFHLPGFQSKKGTFKKPAGAGKAAAKKPAARESVIEGVEEEEIPEKIPEKIPPVAEGNEDKPPNTEVISLHLTKAKDKTYIQGKLEKTSGKKLLCNLQSSTCQQHLEIMLEAMTWGQNLLRTYPSSTFQDMKFSLLQH